MTSGEFHSVRVDKIWVDRDERQRKDLTNIDILADSIRRLGLIHPLVIDRDFKLCAGERRFAAVKMLGYDFVMCQYLDEETDELTKLAIEFEENVKRDPLKWQWQREAVAKCHRIGKSRDPNWTQEKTGEAVGLTQGMVSKYLDITEEIAVHGNTKLLEQDKVETAYNMMQRDKQRRGDKINYLYANDKEKSRRIINADFTEWVKTYDPPKDGPRFNFLHCDFPYGIGSDEMHQGSSVAAHGDYDDSEETYWCLLKVLCENLNKLCTESAHIMFWFTMHRYHDTLEFFEHNSDFEINPFPLVWHKSDGIGLLPDPQRGPRRTYETCLFGSRGDRKIVRSKASSFAAPTDRAQHMSTKPKPVLDHFFQMFVDENTVMLDPTCGSGSAVRAAEALGAPHILGIEINSEFTDRANVELAKWRRSARTDMPA